MSVFLAKIGKLFTDNIVFKTDIFKAECTSIFIVFINIFVYLLENVKSECERKTTVHVHLIFQNIMVRLQNK